MPTSYDQTLQIVPISQLKNSVSAPQSANVYSVFFTHKDRADFREGKQDNVNQFIVVEQTTNGAIERIKLWFDDMDMPIPVEKYDIWTTILMFDVQVRSFGVINAVYRW